MSSTNHLRMVRYEFRRTCAHSLNNHEGRQHLLKGTRITRLERFQGEDAFYVPRATQLNPL